MRKYCLIPLVLSLLIACSSQKQLQQETAETNPNGSKKKENFFYTDGGKKDIVRTVYYFPDGSIRSDSYFKEGKPDSIAIINYQNGKRLKETRYNIGMKNGKAMSWYENGKVQYWENITFVRFSLDWLTDGKDK